MLRVIEATFLLLAPLGKVVHDSIGDVLDSCVRVNAEVGVVKVQHDILHIVGNARSRGSRPSVRVLLHCSAVDQRCQRTEGPFDAWFRLQGSVVGMAERGMTRAVQVDCLAVRIRHDSIRPLAWKGGVGISPVLVSVRGTLERYKKGILRGRWIPG